MTELPTPGAVLDYWIGPATNDNIAVSRLNKRWFIKSAETDKFIETQFGDTLEAVNDGLAQKWAMRGARGRLAAIIVLDQFSRNIHRGTPKAFAYDAFALALSLDSLQSGDADQLTEVERSFSLMPLEHSEELSHQDTCVERFETLASTCRPIFKSLCGNSLNYAHQHRDVIREFGRFPHRNQILGRKNTPEEEMYLAQPGAGF